LSAAVIQQDTPDVLGKGYEGGHENGMKVTEAGWVVLTKYFQHEMQNGGRRRLGHE
jgi:hypothetical protein